MDAFQGDLATFFLLLGGGLAAYTLYVIRLVKRRGWEPPKNKREWW